MAIICPTCRTALIMREDDVDGITHCPTCVIVDIVERRMGRPSLEEVMQQVEEGTAYVTDVQYHYPEDGPVVVEPLSVVFDELKLDVGPK